MKLDFDEQELAALADILAVKVLERIRPLLTNRDKIKDVDTLEK